MDVLIRDSGTACVIIMNRSRTLFITVFAFLLLAGLPSALIVSGGSPTTASVTSQDITRPNIWSWEILGEPELLHPFEVRANVSDNTGGSGIRNVTLRVTGPNATVRQAMDYNATSTLYEISADPLPNDGVFRVWLIAFDMENNSRESYDRFITAEENPETPIDPSITLPYVVLGSLGIGVLAIVSALEYDKRRPKPIRSDSGNGS
ncbi:hypothetical protein EU524_01075 [Candidatus Thorarchaeota archaeon]|nr:MAG: hypothetical protein EU524_01075 [Candidatus Thorarchaeota archaeon]